MENTIIDQGLLGELVDKLIAEKYPGESPASNAELRESTIAHLDDYLTDAIFDALPEERLEALNTMIINDELTSPEILTDFYKQAGLDLPTIIKQATDNFTQEFLGGTK